MNSIDLNFKFSKQQIIKAYQFHYEAILNPKRDATIALILLIVGIYLQISQGFNYLWASLIALPILFLGMLCFAFYLIPHIVYKRHSKYREEYHLRLTDERLYFKTKSIDSEIKWSLYTKIRENDHFLLLYYGKDSFTVIPKNAFKNKEDLMTAILFLKERIS